MAFNTTADYKQTAADMIDETLELMGVLEEGETASANQQASSLRSLNNIIKLWSADTQIYAQNEYQLDLLATTNTYALDVGNVGYIPNKILNATLIDTSTDQEIPIQPLTQEEWYALTDKTTEARPTQYYQKRNPVGVALDLFVWPTPPDTQYDLKLWLQYPLRDVDVVADDLYFTQEWYLPLTFQLAYVLSFKYGLPPADRTAFRNAAMRFKEEAESYDTDGSVFLQPRSEHG